MLGLTKIIPAQIQITLSVSERTHLNTVLNSGKTSVRLYERVQIILLAADGVPNSKISVKLGITPNKAARWQNRYAEKGLAGIETDLPRGLNHGGKNTEDQAKLRSQIHTWSRD